MHEHGSNRLLDALPAEIRSALLTQMQQIDLPISTPLYDAGQPPRYAHFPTAGICSVVTYMEDGNGVEVGLIGPEGLVEAFHLLGPANVPTTGFVQMEGRCLRLPYAVLQQEFARNETLRGLILRFIQSQSLTVNQLAACNRLHEVEERLARWLLMVHDRIGRKSFYLTQEFLSQMIGASRTTVTLAAGSLQRSGLIEYTRGNITIPQPKRLAEAACECYPVTRALLSGLYI